MAEGDGSHLLYQGRVCVDSKKRKNELLMINLKKTMLEEQKEVAAILESEHSGWTQVS